ncbi:MAG: flagellar biosynthetic protein FliO [Pirellulaceae bacterium]|nr:flagellar biosynthetic protein FliO [Pirellulaceae bacterium]
MPLTRLISSLVLLAAGLATVSARGQQTFQPARLPAYQIEAKPLPPVEGAADPAVDPALRHPTDVNPFPFRQVSATEPLPPALAGKPLPLAPRGTAAKSGTPRPAATSTSSAIGSVLGSLGVVLGLFLLVVWFSRRFAPGGSTLLPKEALELLGRAPLGTRQSMQLVRVGKKLILVAVSPTGTETLTEITDPVEVEHLSALCRRGRADSASASFNQVLSQLAGEPAARTRSRGAT